MTDEPRDPFDVEGDAPQDEGAPIEPVPVDVDEPVAAGDEIPVVVDEDLTAGDDVPAAVPAEDVVLETAAPRSRGWIVAVAVIAAILALCTLAACLAAAGAILSDNDDVVTVPPPMGTAIQVPTALPEPTAGPSGALIVISEPDQGDVVDISRAVQVQGKGVALPEGNVVVQALDWQGNVLAEQATTLQGPDVGTGGEGTWSTELAIQVQPGTAGRIRAFSPSPLDGSILAEDNVEVSLGQTAAVQPFVTIDEPAEGALLDISRPVAVRGTGGGLFEGNVVVEALDLTGTLLVRQPATLQGPDVGSGGEGTWSTELAIDVEPGTAGTIRAYSTSAEDGSVVTEDSVSVSLGQTPAVAAYIQIDSPAPGAALDVSQPVRVSGTGAGLPEGNVVVVAADQAGNILAEQPTTLQGADVGAGGEGTWSVDLAVPASGQVAGYIAAFSTTPAQREMVASDHIEVTFSGAASLEGVTWLLNQTIAGSQITAVFAEGQISGSAGCNNYNGGYQVNESGGRTLIEIGPLASTRMMCDEALMEQEGLYLSALQSATEYTLQGSNLTIFYPGGSLLFSSTSGQ